MIRLPSSKTLEAMPQSNRHEILSVFARDVQYELDGLQSGAIVMAGSASRREAIKNAKRRLARVYKAADRYGLYVGQAPDRSSTRLIESRMEPPAH